jgi:hypothetical protein
MGASNGIHYLDIAYDAAGKQATGEIAFRVAARFDDDLAAEDDRIAVGVPDTMPTLRRYQVNN